MRQAATPVGATAEFSNFVPTVAFDPSYDACTFNVTSSLPINGTIRVGSATSINNYFSSVTPVGTPGSDTFTINPALFWDISGADHDYQ